MLIFCPLESVLLLLSFLNTCQVLMVDGSLGKALYQSTSNISWTNWDTQIKVTMLQLVGNLRGLDL